MSHFTVLVVGPDPHAALAPFHQFECTGIDEHVQDLDVTEDTRRDWETGGEGRSFLKYCAEYLGKNPVLEGEDPDLEHAHKYGYVVIDAQDNVLKVVDRTNPNAHWDWYQVGGRWSGMYKLKPGRRGKLGDRSLLDNEPDKRGEETADVFLKGDIDWEAMRSEKEAWATRKYQVARELLDKNPDFMTWKTVLEQAFLAAGIPDPTSENGGWTNKHQVARDKALEIYGKQPAVKALRQWYESKDEARRALAWDGLDDYVGIKLEGAVKEARDGAGITHAVIYNGEWYEVGRMGWFGMVADEKSNWPQEFAKLIDSLPDDTVLTLVDCHI